MASPRDTPEPHICTKCERPRVLLADLCRLHLVELFESEGEFFSMDHPDFDGIQAVGRWFLRVGLEGLPDEVRTSDGPTSPMDMYALLTPEAEYKLSQLGLDMLGCTIMDTRPFDSSYRLEAPMDYEGKTLLRLQVRVPREATEQFVPRLEFVMGSLIRELSGVQSLLSVSAAPAENADG